MDGGLSVWQDRKSLVPRRQQLRPHILLSLRAARKHASTWSKKQLWIPVCQSKGGVRCPRVGTYAICHEDRRMVILDDTEIDWLSRATY